MNYKVTLILITALFLTVGTEGLVSAQDCSIRQTIAVKTLQTIGVTNQNKSGSSNVFGMHNCGQALEAFLSELRIRRESNDAFGEGWVLTQIGDIYFEINNYPDAFDYYSQALPLFRDMNNTDGESGILFHLGRIRRLQKNYPEALRYLEAELVLERSLIHGIVGSDEGRILDIIANIYFETGKDARAFEYFNNRLEFERAQGSVFGESYAYSALGKAYEEKGKRAEALESYQNALDLMLEFSLGFKGESVTAKIDELRATVERLQK